MNHLTSTQHRHTCAIPIDFEPISILESKIFDTFGIVLILVLKRTPLGYWYWYWFWNSFCWVLVLVLVLKQLLLGFGIGIAFETYFCWVLVLVLVLKLTSAGFWYRFEPKKLVSHRYDTLRLRLSGKPPFVITNPLVGAWKKDCCRVSDSVVTVVF